MVRAFIRKPKTTNPTTGNRHGKEDQTEADEAAAGVLT
jgi:hypothetical protein